VRATYLRVLGEDDAPPPPPINDRVRRILEAEAKAEREGVDLLTLLPRDATREDLLTAEAVLTARGLRHRQEGDDMREIAEAIRPFFQGETTLKEAYARWEQAQRPEETPISRCDENHDQ
jgi:hypothetical protein